MDHGQRGPLSGPFAKTAWKMSVGVMMNLMRGYLGMDQQEIVDSRLNDEVGLKKRTRQGVPEVLYINIPGIPQPQERPRVRAFVDPKTGQARAQVYSRKGKTKNYRAMVAHEASLVMKGRDLIKDPLEVTIAFYLVKPKSKPKYKIWADVRPDLDNYIKAVKDALKGVVYRDDAQVVALTAYKRYAIETSPRTRIIIKRLSEGRHYV